MTDSAETLKARRTWVDNLPRDRRRWVHLPPLWHLAADAAQWHRRFEADGEAGFFSKSRRPRKLTASKRTPELTERILTLRCERNLGSTRMQAEGNVDGLFRASPHEASVIRPRL